MVFPSQLAACSFQILDLKKLKSLLRRSLEKAGYHVIAKSFLGHDPFADFSALLGPRPSVIVDAGAFIGEFVTVISGIFPGASIHAFEPPKS